MEKRPISLIYLIFIIALICSYHIYYYFINQEKDIIVDNYINSEKKVSKINEEPENIVEKINNVKEEEIIGFLEIPKINLKKGFYNIDSPSNNVNKNITILNGSIMPNENNSIFILAAHSGNSYLSFFKDLDKLKIDDIVIIHYNNKKYYYSVNDIYEENKNGKININRNIHENILVLTTCSNNKNKQLIIVSKLIKTV